MEGLILVPSLEESAASRQYVERSFYEDMKHFVDELKAGHLEPAGAEDGAITVRDGTLERRFQELPDQWRRETGHLFSAAQKSVHPAYKK